MSDEIQRVVVKTYTSSPQTLSALVMNVKLERPLDSQAPQTEHVYAYIDDD